MSTSPQVHLPGRVDRFGGRLVHWVHQRGDGPAVVLLGGCGVPYYDWDPVVARLPRLEVARMDRPGLAGTPWPGVLPRLGDEVATLVELVSRLQHPAVLVGHSMAGLHIEALARQHPELVAGVVAIDSSVEWQPQQPRQGALWLAAARSARSALAVPQLRPLGSLGDRVLTALQSSRGLLEPTPAVAKHVYRSREAVASVIAEQAAYGQQVWDLAELRTRLPYPARPTVVLTAAGDGNEGWVADQHRLAELLHGRQVVVEDSRHLMMLDRPDLVADAIMSLRRELGVEGDDVDGGR